MEDIKKSIAYSRGVWFCLMHPNFLNAYGYQLTEKDRELREIVFKWIDKGLTENLSPESLEIYDKWLPQMREKITYFRDNIPDSVIDMYAELYEADFCIPSNLIALDNTFHQIFAKCYLNSDYFKGDSNGIVIEDIVEADATPYEEELVGYLYQLRVDYQLIVD